MPSIDERAFEELVRTHHRGIVRLARTVVRSDAAAEEVAQDSWMAVITGIDRFWGPPPRLPDLAGDARPPSAHRTCDGVGALLVTTKLNPPGLRPGTIARPALVERLAEARGRQLKAIYRKLRVASRAEAVARARAGLLRESRRSPG